MNLSPKVWGPQAWGFLHAVSFGYPEDPDDETKLAYTEYMGRLGEVLPCCKCKESFKRITAAMPPLSAALESRASFVEWVYELHESVSASVGVDYDITLDDVVDRYSDYVSRSCDDTCNVTDAKCFETACRKDAPIVDERVSMGFESRALELGLTRYGGLVRLLSNSKSPELWAARDELACSVIEHVRRKGIGPIGGDLPLEEVILLSLLSTSLSSSELSASKTKA